MFFRRKSFLLFFILMLSASAFSQNDQQIDSLKNELVLFEARKKELRNRATPMLDTVKIHILSQLTSIYCYTNPPKAEEFAKEQFRLSKKINYQWGIAESYNAFGFISEHRSNYPLALKYYRLALPIRIKLNDKIGQIDAYANIGVSYAKQSNNPEALKHMLKGLAIAKEINDVYGIANTYNNIGALYAGQNDYEKALDNYFKCVNWYLKVKNQRSACVVYQNIGNIYFQQKKLKEAKKYLDKGLAMALKVENKESAANSYSNISNIYQLQKDYQKALEHSFLALQLREEISDGDGIPSSYIEIGYLYFKQNKNAEALSYIEKGMEMVKKTGELELISQGYKYLSEIYSARNDYKLAYENQVLFKKINDSIFNSANQKKISELQYQYDFKAAENAAKLEQEKRDFIAAKKLESQRNAKYYIFFGMALVVIFLIILIIQRNKIAKIKREKALEEERNRISRDLHDNLGAQLSTVRMFVSSLSAENNNKTEIIENSVSLLDNSIHELRKIMNDMQTTVSIEKGYLAATEELVNKINQLNVITFTLSHHKIPERFDAKIENNLYRITQELVNNTLKYAEAKTVSIDILNRNGLLVFMYEDDGNGYDLKEIQKGNGLENITTRVASIGGTVEFDTTPGEGARTIIEISLDNAEHSN